MSRRHFATSQINRLWHWTSMRGSLWQELFNRHVSNTYNQTVCFTKVAVWLLFGPWRRLFETVPDAIGEDFQHTYTYIWRVKTWNIKRNRKDWICWSDGQLSWILLFTFYIYFWNRPCPVKLHFTNQNSFPLGLLLYFKVLDARQFYQ